MLRHCVKGREDRTCTEVVVRSRCFCRGGYEHVATAMDCGVQPLLYRSGHMTSQKTFSTVLTLSTNADTMEPRWADCCHQILETLRLPLAICNILSIAARTDFVVPGLL